ncbi:MAG: hypothetical protein D6731_05990 [Planctomycetota bacterium]|nr:MAG: hypothetical protein D6731_05990 [Planctomycetota bacterium]
MEEGIVMIAAKLRGLALLAPLASLVVAGPASAGPAAAQPAGQGGGSGAPEQPEARAAEPPVPGGELSGTFLLRDGGGGTALVTVRPKGEGRYAVVRRARRGERTVRRRGAGHLRRGLLLVEWGPSEVLGPEPAGPEPAGPEPAGPEPAGPESAGPEPAGPEPAGPESAGTEEEGLVGGVDEVARRLAGGDPAGSVDGRREAAAGEELWIGASVGRGGANRPEDVAKVQEALAREGFLAQGYRVGVADAALEEALRRFQIRWVGYREPALTARVDPEGRTLEAFRGKRLGERAFVVYSSVGEGGTNAPRDVRVIQEALLLGGYLRPEEVVYGQNSRSLELAIRRYQVARAGFRVGDGRVDINHRTLAALNGEVFAAVPGALPPAGDLPLGASPPAEPEAGATDAASGAGRSQGEAAVPGGVVPRAPEGVLLPPELRAALPPLPEGHAVGAYLVRAHAVQGLVNDPEVRAGWFSEHGVRLCAER